MLPTIDADLANFQSSLQEAAAQYGDGFQLFELGPIVSATESLAESCVIAGYAAAIAYAAKLSGVRVDGFDVLGGVFTWRGQAVPYETQTELELLTEAMDRAVPREDPTQAWPKLVDLFRALAGLQSIELAHQSLFGETWDATSAEAYLGAGAVWVLLQASKISPWYAGAQVTAWENDATWQNVARELVAVIETANLVAANVTDYVAREIADPEAPLDFLGGAATGPDDGILRFAVALPIVPGVDFWWHRAQYAAALLRPVFAMSGQSGIRLPTLNQMFSGSLKDAITEAPATVGRATARAFIDAVEAATSEVIKQLEDAAKRHGLPEAAGLWVASSVVLAVLGIMSLGRRRRRR